MTAEQNTYLDKTFRGQKHQLLGYIRGKIGSIEESEDLLQDVYIQALNQLNVLDEIDNLAGWLYTVAKNRVIDWYRKKRLDTVPIHNSPEDQLTLEELLSEQSESTWDDETRELVNEAIIAAIDSLPEKQKYVFVQQVIEEQTFKEIAEELGESINTVIARKRYAVQFLQHELKEIKDIIKD